MGMKLIQRLLNPQPDGGKRPSKTFDILCISGTGALSIFAAQILHHMEQLAGEPLARRFHLISGTSVGSFMALALSREYPALDLVRLLRQRSYEIYNQPLNGGLGHHPLFKARCDAGAWRSLMAAALGEETAFKEVLHPVLVPSYDITIGRPRLFGAPFSLSGLSQHDMRLIDIAMATTATPALFPIAEMEGQKLVDGIVMAPAPDTLVLREAIHRLDAEIDSIRMVSIGTLTGRFRLPKDSDMDMGLLPWSQEGKLQALTMAAQQQVNNDLLKDLLEDRYCLIDTVTIDEQGLPHPLTADRYVLERVTRAADSTWERVMKEQSAATSHIKSILSQSK